MKIRLFLVLALTMLFAFSAFAGGGAGNKSKAKDESKSCCMDKAKMTKVNDEHCKDMKTAGNAQCSMKASNTMDCCKDMKGSKASNSTKKNVVKLAKNSD